MISLTSPIETPLHRWPAGGKLAALCLAVLALFFIENLTLHLLILGAILALYALFGRVFFISGIAKLRPLWPFVLIVLIWHSFDASYAQGGKIVSRMLSAVALANLVTMTTPLSEMLRIIRTLTKPLRLLGLKTKALELSIALVIRTIPVLVAKADALASAWRARSTRRANWRIILPLTLGALDDSSTVAEALKARGGINED